MTHPHPILIFCSKDEPLEDEHFHSYDYEGPGDSEADITVYKHANSNWVMSGKLSIFKL